MLYFSQGRNDETRYKQTFRASVFTWYADECCQVTTYVETCQLSGESMVENETWIIKGEAGGQYWIRTRDCLI